jgi:hypothetical protein
MTIVSQHARQAFMVRYHVLSAGDTRAELDAWFISVYPDAAVGSLDSGHAVRDNGDGTWSINAAGGGSWAGPYANGYYLVVYTPLEGSVPWSIYSAADFPEAFFAL